MSAQYTVIHHPSGDGSPLLTERRCDGMHALNIGAEIGWVEQTYEDEHGRESSGYAWVEFAELKPAWPDADPEIEPIRLCEDCQSLVIDLADALRLAPPGVGGARGGRDTMMGHRDA